MPRIKITFVHDLFTITMSHILAPLSLIFVRNTMFTPYTKWIVIQYTFSVSLIILPFPFIRNRKISVGRIIRIGRVNVNTIFLVYHFTFSIPALHIGLSFINTEVSKVEILVC